MKIPIGENEIGAIYECGKTSAFFYTLNSAFYNNCMINNSYKICKFTEFKKIYPNQIMTNYYSK
jgi:hypothetical protein